MPDEEWPVIVRAMHAYCRRKYATIPVGFSLYFVHDLPHREPLPAMLPREQEDSEAERTTS